MNHPYAQPQFRVDVVRFTNGQVNTVTVTPISPAGANVDILQVINAISTTLHAAVIDALRPATNNQISRVVGNLQMNNIHNTMHTHTERVRVTDINTNLINEIFDRATHAESNPDIDINDVEWTYYITPGITVGRKCGPAPGVAKLTTMPVTYNGYTPGCLSVALSYALIMAGEKGETAKRQTKDNRVKHLVTFAKELSIELAWDNEMPLVAAKDILELYPEYRIAILCKSVDYPIHLYTGRFFKGNYNDLTQDKTIYLGVTFGLEPHVFVISSPGEYLSKSWKSFCKPCCHVHQNTEGCPQGHKEPKAPVRVQCENCNAPPFLKSSKFNHFCTAGKCHHCKILLDDAAMAAHRCPLFGALNKMEGKFIGEPFHGDEAEDNEFRKESERVLWVYDLESRAVLTGKKIPAFKVNPVTMLFELNAFCEIDIVQVDQTKQVPCLVTYWNVFNSQVKYSRSISDFLLEMLSSNDGKNTVAAHNAAGYDTKLLFDHLSHFHKEVLVDVKPIVRGTKIMRLQIGKTVFTDTLLHLPGSLAALAENYLQEDLGKTIFPHNFNTPQNANYIGPKPSYLPSELNPIPAFDWRYSAKSKKELDANIAEHNELPQVYDHDETMITYGCKDSELLGKIVKIHSENITQLVASVNPKAAFSPWHSTTVAGFVHKTILYNQRIQALIDPKIPLSLSEINGISSNTWVALEAEEHYFAKEALRGGRTEVRKFYHKGPIKCFDVHSMYPSVQMAKTIHVMGKDIPVLYPVGAPIIEVFDPAYLPCHIHAKDMSLCTCQTRRRSQKLNIQSLPQPKNLHDYIQNFDGVICIDATPPNIFHPLLPVFQDNKCVFSCEPIICKTYLSPMLKVAIDNGYIVTKIYRADRYKMLPSLWTEMLAPFYLEKYYYSKDYYTPEQQKEHCHLAETKFGFKIDHSKCSKQAARKMSAKLLINSAWGKLAESVDHTQSQVLSYEQTETSMKYYKDEEDGHIVTRQIQAITQDLNLYKYDERRIKVDPILNKGNVAVAAFVPMYGQLLLWNELHQLGDRVIMCDTDSVKYYDKGGDEYQTKIGSFLGDWEDEGTLSEFVSIGLKSYCLRQGDKETTKLKGLCLKYSHSGIINFETIKEALIFGDIIPTPQMSMDYKFGEGINIREYLKDVKFDESILKGNYDPESFILYPFGYKV